MRIDLDRRYYNSSTYKSITLESPTCKHTLSYDYITLGCIPGACRSEKKETATEIVYVNTVKLAKSFGTSLISRDHDETIRFQCSYKKDARLVNKAPFDPVGDISVSLSKSVLSIYVSCLFTLIVWSPKYLCPCRFGQILFLH